MHFDNRTLKPRYALFHPGTLPPRRDFAACNRHIIAAAQAAAISRLAVEPGFIAARAIPQLACGTVKRLPGAGWRSPQVNGIVISQGIFIKQGIIF
ncbi:hypothetical protein BIY26_10355 [Brenneria goodwinii]|uniref:Uncharacterized protein n=1 Tax=Brenneria goodwinii TaxID=1109412 RepID=A0AAE8JNC0_9GAMM|nr:hypothetical protein [Brenneria goodwinii]ATA23911.1 hypothetical protein AWC36_07210 [Brenneria goodwinii]RLM24566.1 hypothetical protein BIY26_10355 [Brenneria goodwinii]